MLGNTYLAAFHQVDKPYNARSTARLIASPKGGQVAGGDSFNRAIPVKTPPPRFGLLKPTEQEILRLELARAQRLLAEVRNGQERMRSAPDLLERQIGFEFLTPAEIAHRRAKAVEVNAQLEQHRVQLEQKIARLERRIVELGG